MATRPSGFKTDAARAEYCRLYDEAIALSPVPVEESDVETSFGTTHVLTAGDPAKPPLVALHAKSFSSTMWVPLLPTLTASHHVRMLDAVGDVNKSVATDVMSSPARVVQWIDEVHDALAVGRSPIVAASIGTWMGTHYVMARPARVERLAMLSPIGMVGSMRMKWLIKMAIKTQLRPSTAKTEWMLAAITTDETVPKLRAGPWHAIAQQFIFGMPNFRANLREPRPGARCNIERLASSRIPLLILIPRDETGQDGPRTADRYRQQLPHARVELVDDSNHIVSSIGPTWSRIGSRSSSARGESSFRRWIGRSAGWR
jgi:pimeloyl-ACP methyl ester carboxylesterase